MNDNEDGAMIVILNPASGSVKNADAKENGEGDFATQVEASLQKHGAKYEIRQTTIEIGGDVLARQAMEEGARHIVACGGDGTVMSVINGLFEGEVETGERPTLSIVPAGTANLLATALGISTDIEEAVAVVTEGIDFPIDLGRCDTHVFALGLGLGLTEKLISQASVQDKEKLGKLAYVKAMLRELGAQPTRFSFRLDDGPKQQNHGVAIVVANAGDIGGNLQFAPDARMNDGLLDLCILHRFTVRDCARMIAKMLVGNLPADRAVTFLQARKIEILSEPPLDLQIDGEVVEESTPLTAEVIPKALTMRVSSEYLDKLREQEEAAGNQGVVPIATRRQHFVLSGLGAVLLAAAWWLWRRRTR